MIIKLFNKRGKIDTALTIKGKGIRDWTAQVWKNAIKQKDWKPLSGKCLIIRNPIKSGA